MYQVIFYCDDKRNEPVRDFLGKLPKKHREKIAAYIELLAEKKPVELSNDKHYKNLSHHHGLWEIRVDFAKHYYRIFYSYHHNEIVLLLHGFYKDSNETPTREIEIALKNKAEWERKGKK